MINQEIIKELLHYSSETGVFTWKERGRKWFKADRDCKRWNNRYVGSRAGSIFNNGYINISIFDGRYPAHRLAWLYVRGHWPPDQIDHINHNRSDNRWSNLRAVDRTENSKNLSLSSCNTSGIVGVRQYKPGGKWRAQIKVNSKTMHLGYYNTLEEAIKARKDAEVWHEFHINHGNSFGCKANTGQSYTQQQEHKCTKN